VVTSPNKTTGAEAPENCVNDNTHQWAPADVGALMKKACSSKSGTALLFENRDIVPVGMAPGPSKVLNWAHRYLDKDHRQAVYLWASASSWRKNGISVRGFIREMGWGQPSTIDRRKKRGLERIAEGLKRDRIPKFDL
jgi:hypothetical protein